MLVASKTLGLFLSAPHAVPAPVLFPNTNLMPHVIVMRGEMALQNRTAMAV